MLQVIGGSNEYSHQIQYSVGTSGSGSTKVVEWLTPD